MDAPVCNNILQLPPWIIFALIAFLFFVALYQKFTKFQQDMQQYLEHKNKRKDVEESVDEIELPDYRRFVLVEIILALLAFGTALFGFLSSNNITYNFNIYQTCIVAQAPAPTASVDGTVTPIPTDAATQPIPATATAQPHTPVPTNTLLPDRFHLLPLEAGSYWPDGYNIGLETLPFTVARQEFSNIPFEIGRQIDTAGCPVAPNSDVYSLQTNLPNVHAVYILIQAGNGVPLYHGDTIGQIELRFSADDTLVVPLILGTNIRDWARDKSPTDAVMTVTSNTVIEAWRGSAGGPDTGALGGMDILTIDVASTGRTSALERVKLQDTTEINNGTAAPCIHLQAVTVETAN